MTPLRIATGFVASSLVALAVVAPAIAHDDARLEYPLRRSRLVLEDGNRPSKRRMVFQARWKGRAVLEDPSFAHTSFRVAGTTSEDGDTGVIQLSASRWRGIGRPAGSKGFRYDDATKSSGGIRRIVLKQGKRGGVLRVAGGGPGWHFLVTRRQSDLTLGFTLGRARWCAAFATPFAHNSAGVVRARSATAPASCPCDSFGSTFEAIQELVFEKHGCTQAACHGAATSGGLDLRRGASYDDLVDVPSLAGGMDRVEPGAPERSFLWRKLAVATLGLRDVPGASMPNGGLPPLPESQLEALKRWIQSAAPRTGVVIDTESLLDSCLPPSTPIKIRAPDPPSASEGVQFQAPQWELPPHGEAEVCYAVHYDFSATIPSSAMGPCPDLWGGPTQTCFFYDRSELTQDPTTHHGSVFLYHGAYDVDSVVYACRLGARNRQPCDASDPDSCPGGSCVGTPAFGPFTCKGGANAGLACNPKGIGVPAPEGAACGPGSLCGGRVQAAPACVFYGPPDWGLDTNLSGTDNATKIITAQTPVFETASPPGTYTMLPVAGTMVFDSHAFNLTDQPASTQLWLNVWFAPPADRVYPVEHLYDPGDIYVANVPPFEQREYCRTTTLARGTRLFELFSHTHKRGNLFRVWGPGITDRCGSEASRPIKPLDCKPEAGPPILTTTDYSDPTTVRFDPPLAFDSADESSRTFKFCALYDNGFTDPTEVKRRSTSPQPPLLVIPGGPCRDDTVTCLAGPRRGQLCHGKDRVCDRVPGANNGQCDACPVRGGVTTEDEMLILIGNYYVVP